MRALEEGQISLYAAHASLDCAPRFGTGWVLAKMLGIRVDVTFGEYHGGHAGVIGSHDGSFDELMRRIHRELGVEAEAHEHANTCRRVAIVTGSGGMTESLAEAKALGADTYITGEGSLFTRMFAREIGINLIFGTHQATETPGIKALGQRVSQHFGIPWGFIPESPSVF